MAMLYNIKGKKILFIHIPKTGGSSIGTVLMPFDENIKSIVGHQDIKECKSKIDYDLAFTVIRNPWDWRASWYFYIKEKADGHFYEHAKVNELSFNNHIKWLNNESYENFTSSNYGLRSNKLFIKNQKDYIDDSNKNIKILRLENLKEDFQKLMLSLNLEIKLDQHKRKSLNNLYKNHYNLNSIEIIKNLYKTDIKKFNYKY